MTRRAPSGTRRAGGRAARRLAPALAALLLGGCLATTKQVEVLESDVTRRNAWTDERLEGLQADLDASRAENEALRVRIDDLSEAISALGGEVAGRLGDLEAADRRVESQVQATVRKAEVLDEQSGAEREKLLERMNVILEEVVQENARLLERIRKLESSAYTFGRVHKVASGETLATIAKKYGVAPEAVVKANGLSDPNQLRVGQELLIPGAAP